MKKYHIPTAPVRGLRPTWTAALEYLETAPIPIVVKADGLALGKGVIDRPDPARGGGGRPGHDGGQGLRRERQPRGHRGVSAPGPEVSVLSFTDGKTVVPMVSSMDHKRAGDGDTGPNTGGMGTVAPNPYYTDEIAQVCMDDHLPAHHARHERRGPPLQGVPLLRPHAHCRTGPRSSNTTAVSATRRPRWCCPCWRATCSPSCRPCANGTLAETEVKFPGPARLLRGAGLRGAIPRSTRRASPSLCPEDAGRPGALRRRGQAGGRRAHNRRRPGPGGYGPGGTP